MSQIELVDEIEDIEDVEVVNPAWMPISAEGDVEEIPDIPEDDSLSNVLKLLKERDRLRAGYPLTLSMEECLAMYLNAWPGKLYLEDSTEWEGRFSGFEAVDDPRTPEARREVYRAIAEWRKAGKTFKEWKESCTCPLCGKCHRGLVWRGTQTGFYFRTNMYSLRCPCEDKWGFIRQVEKKLPPILRGFSLGSIKPSHLSNLSMERQEQEIEFMKQHSLEGFLFLGPPGTSKSTFGATLFAEAIGRDIVENRHRFDDVEHIWRIEGNRLLEQEQAWACADDRSEVRREVTPEHVIRAVRRGYRPVLFLEEMDKRKLTQFGADIYFRLIDAIDQGKGQLIVTTNLDMEGLRKMLTQEEVKTTGEAILRRLTKLNVRDYYGKET